MIKEINIITSMGAKSYRVGQKINVSVVDNIKMDYIAFTGDKYSHYCGYDIDGKMLFSVNCLCPCEIEYL